MRSVERGGRERTPPSDALDRLMDEVAAEVGDWFEGERPSGELIDFQAKAASRARGLDSEHESGAPAEGV